MAKAAVAVALLAVAFLLAGPAAAAQHRHLLGSGSAQGSASGNGQFSDSVSDGTAFTGGADGADFGAAADFSANAAVNDGKVSFDQSSSLGDAFTAGGQSQAQTTSESSGNNNPGSFSSAGINVGSNDGSATGQAAGSSGRRL